MNYTIIDFKITQQDYKFLFYVLIFDFLSLTKKSSKASPLWSFLFPTVSPPKGGAVGSIKKPPMTGWQKLITMIT